MELLHKHAKGIDLSSNNHTDGEPFDFLKVKEAGYEFVYVKATQGDNYLNPYLLGDTRRAYDAGMRIGVYHFYAEGAGTPEEQANWFVTNGIENVLAHCGDILGLFPVLDYEVGSPNANIRNAFINRMEEAGHPCGQYMDRSFYSTLQHYGQFTWLAWPGWQAHDALPQWVDCVQYGQEVVPGIGAPVDVNESVNYHAMSERFDAPKPPLPQIPRVDAVAPAAPNADVAEGPKDPPPTPDRTITLHGDGTYDEA